MAKQNNIKTRREEEVAQLKRDILDAALSIALEEGWAGVTIRKIAKIIRYSPPAIYRYYGSKEDIMAALYMKALAIFKAFFEENEEPISDIRERMIKGAEKYWNFAFQNPELYELLFTIKTPNFKNEEDILEGKNMFLNGLKMIKSVNPSFTFDQQHDYLANYFSLLHGYVHLALCEKLYTYEDGANDAKKSMIRAVTRFIQSI